MSQGSGRTVTHRGISTGRVVLGILRVRFAVGGHSLGCAGRRERGGQEFLEQAWFARALFVFLLAKETGLKGVQV